MTERWKKRLGDLDKESPGDDVFERSKSGPQLPEEAIARPSTSSRVVTGVAAFLIFALAISVFAIPALRLREGAGGQPLAGIQPLWPWQTVDEVEDFTNDPSPVGVIGSQEFFDPEGTAWAFGHEVLGWDDPQVADLMASGGSTTSCGVGTPVGAPSAATGLIDDVGCQDVGVVIPGDAPGYSHATPTSRPSGVPVCIDFCEGPTIAPTAPGPSPSSPPYRVFGVSSAADVCTSSGPCLTPTAIVTVYQPLGPSDSNAWAVLSSEDRTTDLSVGVGSALHDGESVTASLLLPPQAAPSLGLVVGAGDCRITVSANAVSSTIRQPNGVTAVGMRLDVDLPPRTAECSETEPGYVFVALSEEDIDPGSDPLHEGPTGPLVGMTAVPVVVEWAEGGPPDTGVTGPPMTATPTAAPLEWTTYTDPLGWTMDVPEGWVGEPIDGSDARLSYHGAAFSDGPIIHTPGGPQDLSVDQPFVLLEITHREGGPFIPPADDSSFPLSYDEMSPVEGGLEMSFRGDGVPFELSARFSGGTPSLQQEQLLRRMIRSIRFEPWQPGDSRNGWATVDLGFETRQVVQQAGIEWLVLAQAASSWVGVYVEGDNVVLGPMPNCGEGENDFASLDPRGPLLECPDGSEQGWTVDGQPFPANAPEFQHPVDLHPVITAWDGTLLTSRDYTI